MLAKHDSYQADSVDSSQLQTCIKNAPVKHIQQFGFVVTEIERGSYLNAHMRTCNDVIRLSYLQCSSRTFSVYKPGLVTQFSKIILRVILRIILRIILLIFVNIANYPQSTRNDYNEEKYCEVKLVIFRKKKKKRKGVVDKGKDVRSKRGLLFVWQVCCSSPFRQWISKIKQHHEQREQVSKETVVLHRWRV